MRYRMWGMLTLTVIAAAMRDGQAAGGAAAASTHRSTATASTLIPRHRRCRRVPIVLAEQPAEVRQAVARHQAKGRWPSYVTPGYVLYPFNPAASPLVECAPLRTTDIQLAAGETITDVAIGDSERWMATPASSAIRMSRCHTWR